MATAEPQLTVVHTKRQLWCPTQVKVISHLKLMQDTLSWSRSSNSKALSDAGSTQINRASVGLSRGRVDLKALRFSRCGSHVKNPIRLGTLKCSVDQAFPRNGKLER